MKAARQRFEFCYIYHGDDTLNSRQLKRYVKRDEEDNITSRCKQEATSINARSCSYLIMLLFKQIGRRRSGVYDLVIDIRNDTYIHAMAVNPLRYKKEYIKSLSGFSPALELNKSLRTANISYSIAVRMFKQVSFPFNRNTYYNIRSRAASAASNEFAGLVVTLEKAGFIFKYRIEEEFNLETDAVINRQL
jgi:hypothetical protein